MSDTQELIREYVKKKQTHDQQEEVIRKSNRLGTIQGDFNWGIRESKSRKLITNSNLYSPLVRLSARFWKKLPKKSVYIV